MTARTTSEPDFEPVFIRIAELGLAVTGGEPINRIEGVWRHRFGSDAWQWEIVVNPQATPVASPLLADMLIEPYEAHIYVNDWPFAILSPTGEGVMGRGYGANRETFLAAIAAEIERIAAERVA